MLKDMGHPLETLPSWQRFGTLFKVEKALRHGVDRLTHKATIKSYRQIVRLDEFDAEVIKSTIASAIRSGDTKLT